MPNNEDEKKKLWVPEPPKEPNRLPSALEPKPLIGDIKRALDESTVLPNCYKKMEVRNSPLEGYGVFATDIIKGGEILEEVPCIIWPRVTTAAEKFYHVLKDENFISKDEEHREEVRHMFGFKHPTKYYFKWFPPNVEGKEENQYQCLPLGFGPIYNSANGLNNASWDVKEKTFVFKSLLDIYPGEEIFTYYGYMVSEGGATFNIDEVFGFGLEYAALDGDGQIGILLRNLRFMNDQDRDKRLREEGPQKLMECLRNSLGRVKLKRISVLDGGEEKHPFDFPPSFNLHFTFRKLKEFKETRFKVIKFIFTYVDKTSREEVEEEIMWLNSHGD